MRSPESFDAFYAASRDRLLHETFALTGDVAASRAAVRDAFAMAWHHWRKVSRLPDPEAWVRPLAHTHGRRRHNAAFWHKDKSLAPDQRATLDALSRLSGRQRQLLVLTTLSPLSLSEIARAVGLPRTEAEREYQTATAQFALHRDVPTTDIRAQLDALAEPVASVRWPRATIIRRAGTARRRTHALVGAAIATVLLLGAGSLVATGAGAEPVSLADEPVRTPVTLRDLPAEAQLSLSADDLLAASQVSRVAPRLDWVETSTGDNLDGDGLVLPCQPARFADPAGLDALVRTFEGSEEVVQRTRVRRGGKTRVKRERVVEVRGEGTQFVEASATPEAAQQAYETTRGWFAACTAPRTQLLTTHRVAGVGDEAAEFTFRDWSDTPGGISVAVARSGRLTVTTVFRTAAAATVRPPAVTLAAAVNGLCGSEGAGTCAAKPRPEVVEPYSAGDPPGLLEAVDLPPVSAARGPWVGTPHRRGRANYAATQCDRTSFRGPGIERALSRTFLFPESPRADQFGLTQTVGVMSQKKAKAFVAGVRSRIRGCGQANLGTSVTQVTQRTSNGQDITVWDLLIEVSDERSVPFKMAILRDGGTVSQIGFTPSGPMTMTTADFRGVAERALERLSNLPTG